MIVAAGQPLGLPLLSISLISFVWIVVGLLVMFTALSVVVLTMVWLERKVLGRLQRRLGPTRTGPMGLMQPVADALKLILKEDIIPSSSEKAIFWVSPVIVVISAFMIWVTIPAAPDAVLKNLGRFGAVFTSSPLLWWGFLAWYWPAGVQPTSTAPWAV